MSVNYQAEARAMQEQLAAWRRDLHMHPELGFEERRTAARVAEHLAQLGYQVYTEVAHTGVIGVLEGAGPGPTVMLRFDMDALPIQEENEVAYASQTPGVMHACGHDGHITIGLGCATLLQRHRDALNGTVKLVFQPGEEGLNGAEVMIRDGALDDFGPRPDLAYGLHLWNPLPLGVAGVSAGPIMAAADRWSLTINGRGGHGALPHETADPVAALIQLAGALQTIVSRNVSPLDTAVLSVGTIHGGTAFNVIPGQVELSGTVRTFSPEVREKVVNRMEAICRGVASAMDVEVDLDVQALVPAVFNDPTATESIREVVDAILGQENVRPDYRSMVSEDMSFFLREVPGCYIFLGASNAERGLAYGHHHPRFDFDEAVLPLGVAILAETAARFLMRTG
jgi:amidohydrolase